MAHVTGSNTSHVESGHQQQHPQSVNAGASVMSSPHPGFKNSRLPAMQQHLAVFNSCRQNHCSVDDFAAISCPSSSLVAGGTLMPPDPVSPCCRVSCHVRLLWTALSLMVTAGCTYSFCQPAWYINSKTRDGLGLFNYCVRDVTKSSSGSAASDGNGNGWILASVSWPQQQPAVNRWYSTPSGASSTTTVIQLCGVYGGHQFDLSSLPSNAWQIACVLYGGGCVLLGLGAVGALVSAALPALWSVRLACYTGYIQTMAAVILIGAVVSFPVGLDSKFSQHYCPGARMYRLGSACHVGWAYILGIMSSALVVFCPVLSHYTDIDDVIDSDAIDRDDVTNNAAMTATSTVRLIA